MHASGPHNVQDCLDGVGRDLGPLAAFEVGWALFEPGADALLDVFALGGDNAYDVL